MAINKKTREAVYQKYGGRCAYCGRAIAYKDMHISTGCIYQMPNDQRALVLARGMSDERPEKFAGNGKKPVRRGGS